MSQNFYRKIDDYLMGRLSAEELMAFEHEMTIDPQLRKEVQLSRELKSVILDEDLTSLRGKLLEARGLVEKRKHRVKFQWIAAAGIILIFLSSISLWFSSPHTSKELFEDYYKRFEVPSLSRGVSNPSQTDSIYFFYNSGEYAKILNALEQRVIAEPRNDILGLMLVSAYLELDSLEKLQYLVNNKVQQNGISIYIDNYYWYLGLSLLKQGQIDEAYKMCEKIEISGGKFSSSATKLKKGIKKISD
jgi:hypothetical protein